MTLKIQVYGVLYIYLQLTICGFPNEVGISVIYEGTPIPYIERKKTKFNFVLFNRRKRGM